MTTSVEALRHRLASRQASLDNLRSRIKSAKLAAELSPAKTISDIQKRYLSAVAHLDNKDSTVPDIPIRPNNEAVSSLTSRWDKGIQGVKVQKTTVLVRGDVDNAKKNFASRDIPKSTDPSATQSSSNKHKVVDPGPAQFLIEDDSGVPSWAKNQKNVVIRKENARNSIRDVDVKDLQGTVLEQAARDASQSNNTTTVEAKGNVKAALAMWGKTADKDAKILAQKKEQDDKRAQAAAKEREQREQEKKQRALEAAVAKFSNMQLKHMVKEPNDDIELLAFLERKIHLIDNDIKEAESELDKLETSQ